MREPRGGEPNLSTFDVATRTRVERIRLADALYDSAMREIDAMAPRLTPEPLAANDRRIAAALSLVEGGSPAGSHAS